MPCVVDDLRLYLPHFYASYAQCASYAMGIASSLFV